MEAGTGRARLTLCRAITRRRSEWRGSSVCAVLIPCRNPFWEIVKGTSGVVLGCYDGADLLQVP